VENASKRGHLDHLVVQEVRGSKVPPEAADFPVGNPLMKLLWGLDPLEVIFGIPSWD